MTTHFTPFACWRATAGLAAAVFASLLAMSPAGGPVTVGNCRL